MVSAPPCHGGGRGFKSRRGRKTRPVGFGPGSVAQLVERSTENRKVTGSTPVGATSNSPKHSLRGFCFAHALCPGQGPLACVLPRTGPVAGMPTRQPHMRATNTPRQTNFARNFQRSFFKHTRKRCNPNDQRSQFEAPSRELRAKFLGTARPCAAPNEERRSYELHHSHSWATRHDNPS